MKTRNPIWVVGAVAVVGLLLAGCRAEEQGRVIDYEPGVYKGKKEAGMTAEQRDELRRRVRLQSGSVTPAGGGGAPSGGSVRKPSASPNLGRLNTRAANQKGP